jgi:glycerate kinase
VARVFGPQKGASPETVETLARALDNYAGVIERDLGVDVRLMAGGGASGGLGAGLHALIGARLHPRYDIVMQYYDIDRYLRQADLVITAEGGIDFQTPYGKIPAEVARRAKEYNVPVIALAGTVGQGARDNYAHGITAFTSVLATPLHARRSLHPRRRVHRRLRRKCDADGAGRDAAQPAAGGGGGLKRHP